MDFWKAGVTPGFAWNCSLYLLTLNGAHVLLGRYKMECKMEFILCKKRSMERLTFYDYYSF